MASAGGRVGLFGDVGRQDGGRQAPMDGFTATPNRPTRPPVRVPGNTRNPSKVEPKALFVDNAHLTEHITDRPVGQHSPTEFQHR
ncbi:hypothetical protein GCM10007392_09040 [Saccharospirillum salsuginis]|uniref:Uncharacterized protein n=1 Tax=Saccharospirillum salsuginis TaxID=418750 RepID=A0A918K245_9GAMM|nr:hypothetical protein GCM10007392_09040 [Saccharospirillum salsuginis]